jgi:site-specific DNA-methyltransferase (adenine-specific)
MENLVRYIPEDKIILDTFCGVGTTNVACHKHHRKSFGIDINADYIKIAQKRCHVDIPSIESFSEEGK